MQVSFERDKRSDGVEERNEAAMIHRPLHLAWQQINGGRQPDSWNQRNMTARIAKVKQELC